MLTLRRCIYRGIFENILKYNKNINVSKVYPLRRALKHAAHKYINLCIRTILHEIHKTQNLGQKSTTKEK